MGNELNTRLKLLAVAVGLAWSGMAGAAMLGNISVLSGRGQRLQAEIELALASAAEADGLVVKVYSPEEYWNPGITPPETSVRNVSARTEKRADGSYVVKLASTSSVDTSQVALLAEVSSSAGKRVREYIVQLPNPDSAVANTVHVNELKADAVSVAVKPGDTLNKIARANKPAEVSMERMLVALHRANPQAFSGKNMNRLKAGKVLRMPTASELESVSQPAARKEIHVQVADWNAYRQKVSSSLAEPADEASSQESSGKIGSAVSAQEAADKTPHQEVLKLSKGDAPGADKSAAEVKSLKEKLHAMEEDLTAREQALQESKDRITMLEKNNREMQHLLELKSAAAPVEAPKEIALEHHQSAPEAASAVEATAPVVAPASAVVPNTEAEAPVAKPGSNVPKFLWGGAAALLAGLGILLFMRRGRKEKIVAKQQPAPAASPTPRSPFPDNSELLVGAAIAEEGAEAMVDVTHDPLFEVVETPAETTIPVDPLVEETVAEESPVQLSAEALAVEAAEEQAALAAADLESGFAALDDLPEYSESHSAPDEPVIDLSELMTPMDAGVDAIEAPVTSAASDMDFDIPSFVGNKLTASVVSSSEAKPEIVLGEDEGTTDLAYAEPIEAEPSTMVQAPVELGAEVLGDDSTLVPLAAAPQSAAMQQAEPMGKVSYTNKQESVAEPSAWVSPLQAAPVTESAVVEPAAPMAAVAKPAVEELPLELDIPTIADFTPAETPSLPPMPGMDGVNLNLIDDTSLTEEELQAKGEHWLQVATKLDLARAYQEMGDDAGAREILDEVVAEGDAEQKATAQQLLQVLPTA